MWSWKGGEISRIIGWAQRCAGREILEIVMLQALEVQQEQLRVYLDAKKEARENPGQNVAQRHHWAAKEGPQLRRGHAQEPLDRA
jgi:hypothetical protein